MEIKICALLTEACPQQIRGVAGLTTWMKENGFFDTPASTNKHLCKEGGLAEHALNVYEVAHKIGKTLYDDYDSLANSITIVSLLHDIGKCGQFGKPEYVPNILKSGEVSTAKPYVRNHELLSMAHEIRSIAIISQFIRLTEQEQHAILYHNGLYGVLKYDYVGHETPLSCILHWADFWVSRYVEC